MAIFVAVHGAFFGGWVWKTVADRLAARGHTVHRPSLSGCADREHVGGPDVTLSTHIADIVNLIVAEDLTDVILIGHSYGGMVTTGVAHAIPDRIRAMIHLDALLPVDGECALDLAGWGLQAPAERLANEQGRGWLVPFFLPMAKFCGDDDPARAVLERKLGGVPLGPFTERLTACADLDHLPLLYVYCTDEPLGMFEVSRDRAARLPRGRVVAIDSRHAVMLTRPDDIARLCDEFAA
ncbi:MAG: alpha/beta hydrolase [Alphaproteobacteria bacterium]|nr:alpha/beta hydrolase [Alphaproteobacteria bacterium]